MKQVKVLYNGVEQFTLKVPSDKLLLDVANDAAKAMNVQPKRIQMGPGIVNLVTHMTNGDEGLLKQILVAGVLEWEKGIPKAALKRLAEARLVDVETRRCSAWSFGPKYPSLGKEGLDTYRRTYTEWYEAQRVRVFRDRSVVVAVPTVRGRAYAVEHGLVNEG